MHLRRRLTIDEAAYARIDSVVDVRGTPEFLERVRRMRPFLPPQLQHVPDEQFP